MLIIGFVVAAVGFLDAWYVSKSGMLKSAIEEMKMEEMDLSKRINPWEKKEK